MVAAAVIGGAVVGAVASKSASNAQVSAADHASQVSNDQYQQTRADQLAQYTQTRQDQLDQLATTRNDQLSQLAQTRADQAPYRDAGTSSLAQLMAGSAPGGQFTQDYQRTPFTADPGYQFRLNQGTQGINRAAQAGGSLYSGATLKALARFNSGEASQEYGAYDQRQNTAQAQFNANRDFRRNNLASLAGVGQTATTNTAQAGQNAYGTIAQAGSTATGAIGQAGQNAYGVISNAGQNAANNISQDAIGAGNATASGYVGGANALTSGIGQYLGYSQNQSLLQLLRGGGTAANGYGALGYGTGGGRATDFSQNMQDFGI